MNKARPVTTGRGGATHNQSTPGKTRQGIIYKGKVQMNSIPERSIDTEFIYRRLITAHPGEIISYDDLSQLIGRDVKPGTNGYGNLSSARKIAEKEKNIVFEAVRKIGVKRLTDGEIIKISPLDKIRKLAKKGKERLSFVGYNSLSNEDKITHNTNMTLLSFSIEAMKPSMRKKIYKVVQNSNQPLPIGRTLELFK